MRKVIFSIMTSLDGFYARENGDIDWHYADVEHARYAVELLKDTDTLIFGRKTYEVMAQYWPTAPRDALSEAMNSLPKLVFSKTLRSVSWSNTRLATSEVVDEVAKLKAGSGQNTVMFGSVGLAATFVEHNLVDQYRLIVCPILLGRGLSLFPRLKESRSLQLLSSKARQSGALELVYRT